MTSLQVVKLSTIDSDRLAQLMQADRLEYQQYFTPFPFTAASFQHQLSLAQRDLYWGIEVDRALAGFFMLRGWDQGYDRPAFGIYISESFQNRGLATLGLHYALSWCRLNRVAAMMLKVHPENDVAIAIYKKAGFHFCEICPKTGHHLLEKRLA